MTHLTRCRLNPARARQLTSSPQRLHAAVAMAFPPPSAGAAPDHRVLWRLDETRHPHRQTTLLIVSPTRPDLTHIVEQAGWPHIAQPNDPGWDTRPYTPLLNRLRPGTRLRFRLTANPTRATVRPGGQRSHRTALTTVAEQIQWLTDRAPGAGFTVPAQGTGPGAAQLTVVSSHTLSFKRTPDARPGARVHIHAVTYEGHLDISDPSAFRHTLTHGMGRAKAYGCGLLTLAPLRTP
ncbi:type I-E CRISPR-associated protein Cas6/Cse3/CasE [Streptomyces lydicus]|uniref:type I-E CRISPR-associated protein Cas6/Cse3/CasE n=1 Tax=Streptomyces lydicus TaxID=47763 RepID=UPI0010129499|nr:type I-E CRISPR-associated protein Cas6/Cse3/CasE [Streptomyces lydicus]MCZ1012130.1 type I-E CRISPR-associated protein Cas6/Cse3/CasE [Streptomyces lydicus]